MSSRMLIDNRRLQKKKVFETKPADTESEASLTSVAKSVIVRAYKGGREAGRLIVWQI